MDLSEVAKTIELESGRYTGGPIQVFEKVGRDTFVTLVKDGLLPHHKVLDFGAGCLRLGYWFVRFLDSGNYYAIEPAFAMLEAGKKHLFGPGILRDKNPHFLVSDKCDMSTFGIRFNYVVARSILTHAHPAMLHKIFEEFAKCAAPEAAMLVSYWAASGEKAYLADGLIGDDLGRDRWGFTRVVKYSLDYLQRAAGEYGLVAEEVMLDSPRISEQIWLRISVAGSAKLI